MSAYNPPIRNLPIFDTLLFREANPTAEGGGTGALDPRYCRFPTAQGTLSVPDLNLNTTQIHLGTGSASAGTNAIGIGTNTLATGPNTISIGNGAGGGGSGLLAQRTICIVAGAGVSCPQNQDTINIGFNTGANNTIGRNSINIGRNAGSHSTMASNSIQINATGVNVTTQTSNSSCVITPIRAVIPPTASYSVPLLYNTTTFELFTINGEPDIDIALTGTINLDNNAYNRFIFISSVALATDRLNMPTPVITFPASITIFNSSATTCVIGSPIANGLRQGATTAGTFNLAGNSAITYHSNGAIWIRTSSV